MKTPLGHNRTNGAVYSKIKKKGTSKLRSLLPFRYSIVIPHANTKDVKAKF